MAGGGSPRTPGHPAKLPSLSLTSLFAARVLGLLLHRATNRAPKSNRNLPCHRLGLEVRNQGVGRVVVPPEAPEEGPTHTFRLWVAPGLVAASLQSLSLPARGRLSCVSALACSHRDPSHRI